MSGQVDKTFYSYPSFPSSPTAGGAIGHSTTPRRRPLGSTHEHESAPDSDLGMMLDPEHGGFLEDFIIISGLVAVQVVSAVYILMLTSILALGLKPLFLVIFSCTATSIFVLPFAIAFENTKWPSRLSPILIVEFFLIAFGGTKWPSRLSPTLIVQFFLIAFGGVTTFQALMLIGIEKTSPEIASSIPNLAPGIIFVIAACLRFEKADIKCKYTRAKILGTMVCLGGAITMSFLQSPPIPPMHQSQTSLDRLQDKVYNDWIIGCLCLLAAVLVVSCSTVLQAATMIHFQAPFSLCSITSFLGAILTVIVQIITEGKVEMGNPMVNIGKVVSVLLLGGMVIALCVSFQTWAVKKKGPVLVSMFSPVQTLCSTILSSLVLGQVINLGSLAGMVIMFCGLYLFLWAKRKEESSIPNDGDNLSQATSDVESPLLS